MLPPFGLFSIAIRRLASRSEPMSDWMPELSEDDRKQAFLDWRDQVRKDLSNVICPFLRRSGGGQRPTWDGIPIVEAEEIIKAELDVIIQNFQGSAPTIRDKAPVISSPEFGSTQLEQFLVEDKPSQPAAINLRDYVSGLSQEQFEKTRAAVDDAYSSKKLPGLFWFKNEFMRVRPHQAALILGREDFINYPALSARHSSFCSGHCLEGILFSAAIEEYWRSSSVSYSPVQLEELAQYAVDFGDRRVFAGVHYPSDNIGSWIISLRLAKYIFSDSGQTLAFIRRAIIEKSKVFEVIDVQYEKFEALVPLRNLLRIELSMDDVIS
ncbi:phosphatase PAP2 family protein [uncultured Tateyamaria sp.]|uniref:phosphatase PAP2 family protein n=1 Tax=uncultured Tateyamaria sp. TaxID=455651 RepID=UPI00260AA8BD|nr:phosphatase PAP2 family protein [uncultured Tateyamaria sp.]